MFEWNEKKNREIQEERCVTFQDIVDTVEDGGVLFFGKDKRQDKYPGQCLLVEEINNYSWVVPCEFRGDKLRLITIYPSRKYKHLLRGRDEKDKS
jgi:uncharacterized DUF497 family protein